MRASVGRCAGAGRRNCSSKQLPPILLHPQSTSTARRSRSRLWRAYLHDQFLLFVAEVVPTLLKQVGFDKRTKVHAPSIDGEWEDNDGTVACGLPNGGSDVFKQHGTGEIHRKPLLSSGHHQEPAHARPRRSRSGGGGGISTHTLAQSRSWGPTR